MTSWVGWMLTQLQLFVGEALKVNSAVVMKLKGVRAKENKVGQKTKTNSHAWKTQDKTRFSVPFNDTLSMTHWSLLTAEFAFFNTSSPSSSWVDVRRAPPLFRSCTNRPVPQTWLLKGWILWTAPLSLKHLFSQCWKMNTMFVCFFCSTL